MAATGTNRTDRESRSFSLPKDLLIELDAQAEARVVSPAKLMENAIRKYLPTLPSLDDLESGAAGGSVTGP